MSYVYVRVKAALLYISVCHTGMSVLHARVSATAYRYVIPVCPRKDRSLSGLYTDIHVRHTSMPYRYFVLVCHAGILCINVKDSRLLKLQFYQHCCSHYIYTVKRKCSANTSGSGVGCFVVLFLVLLVSNRKCTESGAQSPPC